MTVELLDVIHQWSAGDVSRSTVVAAVKRAIAVVDEKYLVAVLPVGLREYVWDALRSER